MTTERANAVTSNGNPMTLLGLEIKVGDRAPDFRVVDQEMRPLTLADTQGKVRVFSLVPSLDTHVCTLQSVWFDEVVTSLPGVEVYTVSVDLPFAQTRWEEENSTANIKIVSDYQDRSFGLNWGALLKEVRLLTRAVFVVDADDIVRYVEYVPEISNEPDYEPAVRAVREIVG